jgi:dihydrofolate synthase/folylpolyglutamate synthase
MTYEEAIAYIHGMYWRGSKLGLVRTVELCGLLGDPQKKLKFIHVAGTNGKGSTCAMLSRILCAQGYRTGLFVSPFVDRFNERIQLNNEPIPDDDLAEIITEIAPIVDSMENPATEFEVITAAAFLYYARQKCDYVVLEVGLGGELDSTNVIDTPLLAIITAIDFDHMHILGDTIEKIASAKAGIIKDNGTVLFYGQHPDALPVIEDACKRHGASLHVVDRSSLVEETYDLHGQTFSYRNYAHLKLGLLGRYQMRNAATVIDAVELLRNAGVSISEEALRQGLAETVWPARFELLREDPPFFVDGGHNPHGVRGTVETYQRLFPDRKARLIMGMMRDKDVSESIRLLLPIAKEFYTVTPQNDRAMPSEELAELIGSFGAKATPFRTVADAVETAVRGNDPALAVGSLYMAGEVHQAFRALRSPEE